METKRGAPRKRRRPAEAKVLKYKHPDMDNVEGKALVRLVQSDIMMSNIQIVKEGGDNALHSHAGMDGFWFVLKGRARFYGTLDDELICELGPHEGVYIPRTYPYWFEKAGDEELELLQVEAIDRSVKNTRTDHKPLKEGTAQAVMFDMEGNQISHRLTGVAEEKQPEAMRAK
jgi:mannose-6-phosphate isomerase-like protein (cupin superfamily)